VPAATQRDGWIIANARSALLLILGLAMLLAGVFLADLPQSTGVGLIVVGSGIFLVGVLLPLVTEFQIGPGGFSAKLRERDREFQSAVSPQAHNLETLAVALAGDPTEGRQLAEKALAGSYGDWTRAESADPVEEARRRLVAMAPEAPPQASAGGGELVSALAAMGPEERAAVVLRLLEGRAPEQIAPLVEQSPDAVNAAIKEGLAKLEPLLTGGAE
jgi:hypothetical protein